MRETRHRMGTLQHMCTQLRRELATSFEIRPACPSKQKGQDGDSLTVKQCIVGASHAVTSLQRAVFSLYNGLLS